MKLFIWNLIKLMHLGPLLLYIHPKSALKQLGWFKSFHSKSVTDRNGNSIPWWTYSCIDFLEDRLNRNMRVLEFGCGGSTIWLSKRVKEVISFENYPEWAAKTRRIIEGDSRIIDINDFSDTESIIKVLQGKFDILIIDNLGNRIDCAKNNLIHLSEDGIIVWDNTDGPDAKEIKEFLRLYDFKEISFTGMIAQELSYSRTSIFYKEKNCLGI